MGEKKSSRDQVEASTTRRLLGSAAIAGTIWAIAFRTIMNTLEELNHLTADEYFGVPQGAQRAAVTVGPLLGALLFAGLVMLGFAARRTSARPYWRPLVSFGSLAVGSTAWLTFRLIMNTLDKIFVDFVDSPTNSASTAADWGAIGIGLLAVSAAAFWVRGVGADPGVEEAGKIQQAVKRGF